MFVLYYSPAILLTVGSVAGLSEPVASEETSRSLQRRSIVEIVVLLRPDAADRMRSGTASELRATLATFGAVMRTQHPRVADPLLGQYFNAMGVPTKAC